MEHQGILAPGWSHQKWYPTLQPKPQFKKVIWRTTTKVQKEGQSMSSSSSSSQCEPKIKVWCLTKTTRNVACSLPPWWSAWPSRSWPNPRPSFPTSRANLTTAARCAKVKAKLKWFGDRVFFFLMSVDCWCFLGLMFNVLFFFVASTDEEWFGCWWWCCVLCLLMEHQRYIPRVW